MSKPPEYIDLSLKMLKKRNDDNQSMDKTVSVREINVTEASAGNKMIEKNRLNPMISLQPRMNRAELKLNAALRVSLHVHYFTKFDLIFID